MSTLNTTDRGVAWCEAINRPLDEVQRYHLQDQNVIVRATVIGHSDVLSRNELDQMVFTLQDMNSHTIIDTAPVTDPLLTKLQKMGKRYAVIDFLGAIRREKVISDKPSRYIFRVGDCRVPEDPIELMMASPEEIAQAEAVIAEITTSGSTPIEWLIAKVAEVVGIQGLDVNRDLHELLRVIVLQALSYRYVHNANGKIHSLVIGPPSSGKKLLVSAISILNAIFEQAGHKLSTAGLIGRCQMKKGEYATKPGHIPLAHSGVFVVEDIHDLSRSSSFDLWGVVGQCMEDARVFDSTASRMKMEANTGIHMDINRLSDLHPLSELSTMRDLSDIPLHIISRFDVIYDLCADADLSFRLAREIARAVDVVGPDKRQIEDERARKIKLVVATLQRNHPVISITPENADRIADLVTEVQNDYCTSPEVTSIMTRMIARMVHSCMKLASAHARGCCRDQLDHDDIEVARHCLMQKAEFICSIPSVRSNVQFCNEKQRVRYGEAYKKLLDQTFNVHEYCSALQSSCSLANAYRDIKYFEQIRLVRKLRHGVHQFVRQE